MTKRDTPIRYPEVFRRMRFYQAIPKGEMLSSGIAWWIEISDEKVYVTRSINTLIRRGAVEIIDMERPYARLTEYGWSLQFVTSETSVVTTDHLEIKFSVEEITALLHALPPSTRDKAYKNALSKLHHARARHKSSFNRRK